MRIINRMYSRLIRTIALFAVLICLPLQGLAAVTMPACQAHSQKMEMQADAGHTEGMSHCDQHNSSQPAKNTSCDKCSYCFLSAAQAIIPFNGAVELNGIGLMVARLIAKIPDSVPSSLFHPPKSIFA